MLLIENAGSLSASQIAQCHALVDAHKWQRIQRFEHQEDASRSLVGDLAARMLLAQRLDVSPADICFVVDSFGKPHLDGRSHIDFSISHSADYAVCVLSTKRVGVDIEHHNAYDDMICRRFFSASEYGYLNTLAPSERQAHFYRLWTLKESYLKAIGQGLGLLAKAHFAVPLGDVIRLSNQKSDDHYCFVEYEVHKEYSCSVCSVSHRALPHPPQTLSCHQLVNYCCIGWHGCAISK